MRDIVAMHARLGIARRAAVARRDAPPPADIQAAASRSPARSSATTRSSITTRSCGPISSTSRVASVRLHAADDRHRDRPGRGLSGPSTRTMGGSRRRSSSTRRAAGRASSTRMAGVACPEPAARREVLVTAPLAPLDRGGRDVYRPSEGWFNQTLRGEIVMGAVDPVRAGGRGPALVVGVPAPDGDADDPQGACSPRRDSHPPVGRHVRHHARPCAAGRADPPARRLVAGARLERPRDAARAIPHRAARRAPCRRRAAADGAPSCRTGSRRPKATRHSRPTTTRRYASGAAASTG